MVYEESGLCSARINQYLATEASLTQTAISTGVAAFGKDGGKAARKQFAKLLQKLSGGDAEEKEAPPLTSKRGAK